jgi:hypothetical protein
MVVKIFQMARNFSFRKSSKIWSNWDFWSEKKPSGNPGVYLLKCNKTFNRVTNRIENMNHPNTLAAARNSFKLMIGLTYILLI